MTDTVLNWLLEDSNPAVQYRTRRDILHEDTDGERAKNFMLARLPAEWYLTKGKPGKPSKWSTFYRELAKTHK